MRGVGLLLVKDARLMWRSPAMLLVLIAYPIVVALLVALALQNDDRRPNVALVNLDGSGRTVQVGEQRLSVDDYVERLADRVNVRRLDAEGAADALSSGRVSAVVTIPEGFIADLQSGVQQPVVRLDASRRSPIEADAIQNSLEAAVFRLNQSLAEGYVLQVLRLVDLVVDGGEIGIFGRSGDALGLRRSRVLVVGVQERLTARGQSGLAGDLTPLINFIDETQRNLDLAKPAANAIRAPIELRVSDAADGREPLSAFGVAGALLVSLGLVGVLLGAATMSSEREDHAIVRLGRGLVSAPALVLEKILFTAIACVVVGLLLLGGVTLLTSIAVGRWGVWLVVLVVAGLGFGALGVLAGTAARETRGALLIALMVALPFIALSVLPGAAAGAWVGDVMAFGPAFDAFQALLVDPTIDGGRLARSLGHTALLAAIVGVAATLVTRRRAAA